MYDKWSTLWVKVNANRPWKPLGAKRQQLPPSVLRASWERGGKRGRWSSGLEQWQSGINGGGTACRSQTAAAVVRKWKDWKTSTKQLHSQAHEHPRCTLISKTILWEVVHSMTAPSPTVTLDNRVLHIPLKTVLLGIYVPYSPIQLLEPHS